MYSICKEFSFCAAHRLHNHKGKCANLHGHTYRVLLHVTRDELDDGDMVVDFDRLTIVKSWISNQLDHKLLLSHKDPLMQSFEAATQSGLHPEGGIYIFNGDPTAELIAREVFQISQALLRMQPVFEMGVAKLVKVVVFESATSSATFVGGLDE